MSLLKTFLGTAALNAADSANQDAIARRGEDMIRDQQARNQDTLIGLQQQHIDSLEARANRPTGTNLRELELEQKVKAQHEEIEELSADLRSLRGLLSKPFEQIALESNEFKNNYRKETSNLARRTASELAFKELAMTYAADLNKSSEQVLAEQQVALAVILSGESVFGNNIDCKTLADLCYEDERKKLEVQYERNKESERERRKKLIEGM